MIKKISLFLLLSCLAVVQSAFGQAIQYESQIIEKIKVEFINAAVGSNTDTSQVLSRIRIKEGDIFSQTEFDNDLKSLAQEFDRIEPSIESTDQKVYITLKLWPKPIIRCINWNGNNKMPSKKLLKELGITPGSIFDRLEFNKAFHKLKSYYVKKGFFEAELEYDVSIDPSTNEVDIDICVNEGRSGRVKDIVFQNFTCEEEEEILELMITKKWSIFTSWLTDEGTYHEEAMQQDQFSIVNYLQNEGYADAKVEIDVCEASSNHRIIINIIADKGELYYFGGISFEGNKIFSDEGIRERFTFEEGDPYSPDEVRNTIQSITTYYGIRGYIDSTVDFEPQLDCDENVYKIHLIIDEGDQYRVGLIKVFGNNCTQTNVILHETLLIPGEIFNIERLKRTEEKLQNIGYFKNVNVYAVRTDDECSLGENYRDVHIEVEETSTGHFGAFFGYSTTESIFGGFKITERNFNYKGLGCVWEDGYAAVKGGGEYAQFSSTIGAKSYSYIFSWTKPFFMDTPWSIGFDLERSSNRYISRDYDINAWGFSLHAKYQINPFLRFGWHYRIRDTDVTIDENHPSLQLQREANNSGLISASGISLAYDSTDCPQMPRNGIRSVASAEYAGLGGDHTFFGLGYVNSLYFPIGKKGVLRYRADAKFLFPVGNTTAATIPLDERLFLGNDDTVRGFRPFAIGPKFPEGDPRGGMSLLFLSAEYSQPLFKRVDGFLFVDAGQLTFKTFDLEGSLKVAIGYGLRLKILEGAPPLIVGFGYPLNANNDSDVKRFFFAIGGRF